MEARNIKMRQSDLILVVDDDPFSRKLVQRAIAKQYTVEMAENGEEGLKKAEALKPDLILLDVEMPGMNGYEVCDRIKTTQSTRNIPVMFVSGHESVRERVQGFEVGGDDYVTKPFEKESLLAKINVLLKYRDKHNKLEKEVEEAQQTAYNAMSGSSELGLAVRFAEDS